MNEFNKIEAFDKLTQLLQQPPNSTTSQCIQLIFDGQNYLQKIHDDAFKAGFQKGCDATNQVKNLNNQ